MQANSGFNSEIVYTPTCPLYSRKNATNMQQNRPTSSPAKFACETVALGPIAWANKQYTGMLT